MRVFTSTLTIGCLLLCATPSGHTLEAPSELVGYRACVRLMFSLVDCLVDACDLQLDLLELHCSSDGEHNSALGDSLDVIAATDEESHGPHLMNKQAASTTSDDNGTILLLEPRLTGAVRPSMDDAGGKLVPPSSWLSGPPGDDDEGPLQLGELVDSLDEKEDGQERLIEYLRSTRPMNWRLEETLRQATNWRAGSELTTTRPTRLKDRLAPGVPHRMRAHSAYECWRDAIKWLRQRLLAIRMRLLACSDGGRGNNCLADALLAYGEIEQHLHDVCTETAAAAAAATDKRRDVASSTEMRYILETVQVLGELRADALKGRRGPRKRTGGNSLDEARASDSIKRHYAYLTQIVSAFSLIFDVQASDQIFR